MEKERKRAVEHYEREFGCLRELAERTGKNYKTLYRAAKAGKIKTVKFGGSRMVPKGEIERVLSVGF
jgi:excisionase family DNA binding protein